VGEKGSKTKHDKEKTMPDLSPPNNKEVLHLLRPKIFKNIPIT
jgi:hypothetical protein